MLRSPTVPRRIRRPLAIVVLLAFSALSLVACGGESASSKSVGQLLRETFGGSNGIKSGQVDATLGLSLQGVSGLSGPVSLKLSGPFQGQGKKKVPKFDLALTLRQGAQSITAGAISTGERSYVRLRGQTYDLGQQVFEQFRRSFQKQSGSGGGATLSALGIDPRAWLTHPRKAGEATVKGTKTIRMTAGVDVARFLQDANALLARGGQLGVTRPSDISALTPEQRRDLTRSVKSATVDVYTGADDTLLRRIVLKIVLAVPPEARASLDGLRSGTISLDFLISGVNQPQKVDTPAGAKPLSALSSGLGQGPAPLTSPRPTGGTPPAYVRCLQAAGQDVAKIQKCANLLQ